MALHILLSWDIEASGDAWKSTNSEMKACLDGFSWVKPLSTTFIVRLKSIEDRQVIKDRLIEVCRGSTQSVHLLVSPVMEGGGYGGFLPKGLWMKIALRTGGVE